MKRPFGLVAAAVLTYLVLVSETLFTWTALAETTGNSRVAVRLFSGIGLTGATIFLAFVVVYAAMAIYMVRLGYWARRAAIAFIAVALLVGIVGLAASLLHRETMLVATQLLVIVVCAWIMWYLMRPKTKDAFSAAPLRHSVHLGTESQPRQNESSPTVIKELTRQESLEVLARSHLGRLACTRGDQPYIVPIYFAYDSNCLHSFSTVGQKIEWMRDNPLVCVQVDEVVNSQKWVSVIVFGRFEELPDAPEWQDARAVTHGLLRRKAAWWEPGYVKTIIGGTPRPLVPVFYRIHIEKITGHRAGVAAT